MLALSLVQFTVAGCDNFLDLYNAQMFNIEGSAYDAYWLFVTIVEMLASVLLLKVRPLFPTRTLAAVGGHKPASPPTPSLARNGAYRGGGGPCRAGPLLQSPPSPPTPRGSSTSAKGGGACVRHATARAGVAQARGAMERMKVRRPVTGLWDLPPRTCVCTRNAPHGTGDSEMPQKRKKDDPSPPAPRANAAGVGFQN